MYRPTCAFRMQEGAIDEDLFSRQIYVLGMEAMKRMGKASVLISGMGGLGVEIAKNVILAGIRNVTVHDQKLTEMKDLASQFYLNESVIGQNRAMASLPSLVGLNEYVSVSANTSDLTNDLISNFDCVVLSEPLPEGRTLEIAKFCHEKGIKFIMVETRGVFGYIFNDFGEKFLVREPRGDKPSRFLLEFVSNDSEGLVTIDSHDEHNLCDGDRVLFDDVEGMTELNGREFPVKVINKKSFSIGDTSSFTPYTCSMSNGYGTQVIPPNTMDFRELSEALKEPHFTTVDMVDFCRDRQVFLCFWGYKRVLERGEEITVDNMIKACTDLNSEYKWVDEVPVDMIAEFTREDAVIAPMTSVFGGISGQEVMKSVSGKFTPIPCFMALGYTEALQKDVIYEPQGDRYDPYRLLFGNAQQEKMMNLKYFLVGAGAIGCEILKNWALMGVGCKDGKVVVTDMDQIERSNLNRQFLFRNTDIGKMKSAMAVRAVTQMNPDMKATAESNRVGLESEKIYDNMFWESLDGVCNALDNVDARMYNDSQCVYYGKPLLESGTMGTMAHYEIIMPHLTNSYASYADVQTKGIPACTLHQFPTNINHCAMWAKDVFGGLFTMNPGLVNQYLTQKGYVKKMMASDRQGLLANLQCIEKMLLSEKPQNFDDCVKWARMKFEDLFNWQIRELVHENPPDKIVDGHPFWTGPRRLPAPLVYDMSNEQHAAFITAAAHLYAHIFGIKSEPGAPEKALSVEVPKWSPKNDSAGKKVSEKQALARMMNEIKHLCQALSAVRDSPCLVSEEFEKDDPTNHHVDFIAAAANLRASNYRIAQASALEIKQIAGNIIPAIATTTGMVCGFVCLEMFKVHSLVPKSLYDFRSGFVNLAGALFSLTIPDGCKKNVCKANNMPYTLWDKWVIEGDLTLRQLIEALREKYGLVADEIVIGQNMTMSEKNMDRLVRDICTETAGLKLSEGKNTLQVHVMCGRDVDTPDIFLKYK